MEDLPAIDVSEFRFGDDPASDRMTEYNGMYEFRIGDLSYVVRAVFDNDYAGNFYFCQVWDHGYTGPLMNRWQYVLILSCAENNWVPKVVCEWHEWPGFRLAATYVDDYLNAPEALKFMLR